MAWISASEGAKFAETVRDFTTQLQELGPNPLRVTDGQEKGNEGTVV